MKLLLFLLLIPSLYANNIISLGNNSCSMVKVYSKVEIKDKIFATNGVGWAYIKSNQVFIITPAHVIENASDIKVSCKKNKKLIETQEVQLVKISHDYDLALLKLKNAIPNNYISMLDPNEINKPELFELGKFNSVSLFNDPRGILSLYKQTNISSVFGPNITKEDLKQSEKRLKESDIVTSTITIDKNPVIKKFGKLINPLITKEFAIRPGMSGSPIFNSWGKVVAMAVKTKLNSNISLAINILDIIKFLEVEKTDDLIKVKYTVKGNTLIKKRSLISGDVTFYETCNNPTYQKSSSWRNIKGGGDWADGGNKANLENIYSGVIQPIKLRTAYPFLKSENKCKRDGLMVNNDELIGIYNSKDNHYQSIRSLEDIYNLYLEKKEKFNLYINKYGVFKNDKRLKENPFFLFCNPNMMKGYDYLKTDGITPKYEAFFKNGNVHVFLNTSDFVSRKKAKTNFFGSYKSFNGIICTDEGIKLNLKVGSETAISFTSANLEFTGESITGKIRSGLCQTDIDIRVHSIPKIWQYKIKSKNFTTIIDFNPDPTMPILRLNNLDIHKRCMWEENDNKHYPWSDTLKVLPWAQSVNIKI